MGVTICTFSQLINDNMRSYSLYQESKATCDGPSGSSIIVSIDLPADRHSSNQPIISAVFEKISQGHGRVTELVNKDGLCQSLSIMQDSEKAQPTTKRLSKESKSTIHLKGGKAGPSPPDPSHVNEKWTGIFQQENTSPANLRTEITQG